MALMNTLPDYMNFNEADPGEIRYARHLREFHWVKKLGIEEYPALFYKKLLEYIKDRYEGQRPRLNPLRLASGKHLTG